MKKLKFNIGTKIFGGFMALIVIFAINAAIGILTIDSNNKIIKETSEIIDPSAEAIDDFNLLVTESKMLVTNWVYLQSNQEDKDALKDLQEFRYPELKEKLVKLTQSWEKEEQRLTLDSIFTNFEALIEIEKGVMASLQTFENYEDPMVKLLAEDQIESEVLPRTKSLKIQLMGLGDEKRKEANAAEENLVASSDKLKQIIIILGITIVVIGLIGAFTLTINITRPINYVKGIIVKLGNGDLPEQDQKKIKVSKDEIGEIATAVDNLVSGLRATTGFAENIGNGNYQAEFTPLSENDVLGNALIEMRDNLHKVAEEDKRRNWATQGEAKFGEILRLHNNNVNQLCDSIITNLVKYMGANQGGLFLIQDHDEKEDPYMTLEACYAWDRKKYLEQQIVLGEGLAGQAWLEKDAIYITDVPDDYINITSGLGDANPNSILIVPLLVNEEVYGVIEIASFNEFGEFERKFVEKVAESIASTISSVRINQRTQKLLEESTQMTEQMRAQEEEMRQNNEELMATQEEMSRKQTELEKEIGQAKQQEVMVKESENRLQAVVDSIPKSIYWKDKDLKYLGCNKIFAATAGLKHPKDVIGKTDKDIWKDTEVSQEDDITVMQQNKSLLNQEQMHEYDGKKTWFNINKVPLVDINGNVSGVLTLFEDVTDRKEREEELNQSLEELTAVQEAMEKSKKKEEELLEQVRVKDEQLKTLDKDPSKSEKTKK
jgi:PAS domain S-box-containing protein